MSDSILERIQSFVRDQSESVSQADVVKAFPGEQASVVRLTLQALRRQGVLTGSIEGSMPYYWAAKPTKSAAGAPLRVEKPTPPASLELVSQKDRILKAMAEGGKEKYTAGEISEASKLMRDRTVELLRELVDGGRVFGRGLTSGRRYSLKPFLDASEVPAEMAAPVLEVARHAETRREEEAQERETTRIAATSGASGMTASPRFAYWSDGTLELDCETCSGKLNRRDIEALRAFVAVLPPLAGN